MTNGKVSIEQYGSFCLNCKGSMLLKHKIKSIHSNLILHEAYTLNCSVHFAHLPYNQLLPFQLISHVYYFMVIILFNQTSIQYVCYLHLVFRADKGIFNQ